MIKCQICNVLLKNITWNHLKKHGITIEEYKKKFGIEYVQCKSLRKIGSRGKGSSGYTWKWTEEQKDGIRGNKNCEGYKNVLGCRWTRSEENKEKDRIRMNKGYKDGTLIPKGGRCKWYPVMNYVLGKIVNVQGRLEKRFAKLLNKLRIKWIRPKPKTYILEGEEKKYFCDFWLRDYRMYVEVKGFIRDEDYEKVCEKQKMMVKRGKRRNHDIEIVFGEDIEEFEKDTRKLKKFLKG